MNCLQSMCSLLPLLQTMAMVPLVDMLNHKRPPQTKWCYDQNTQSFLLTSTQPIAAHEELFDSYGAKCNSRFLLNYGFTIMNNRGQLPRTMNFFSILPHFHIIPLWKLYRRCRWNLLQRDKFWVVPRQRRRIFCEFLSLISVHHCFTAIMFYLLL